MVAESTVQAYVRQGREELGLAARETFVPQESEAVPAGAGAGYGPEASTARRATGLCARIEPISECQWPPIRLSAKSRWLTLSPFQSW